jgi:prepilin-type N-terminal cleavage/methylation domain-containing protein
MKSNLQIGESRQRGFTLTEMLIATIVVIVGLVAVAQLIPTSVLLNSNNRSDGAGLAYAQRVMEALRSQPMTAVTFSDLQGVVCPLGATCNLGDPSQPQQVVGSPISIAHNAPFIDFSASPVSGYSFSYTDPNDPTGATNDVRWAIITTTNPASGTVTGRRIILGVFRKGMKSPSYPITIDTMVEK